MSKTGRGVAIAALIAATWLALLLLNGYGRT